MSDALMEVYAEGRKSFLSESLYSPKNSKKSVEEWSRETVQNIVGAIKSTRDNQTDQ